ncbi:MAG: hypothetical protein ACYC99_03535 [Candidatus Geothermincolia bacterium]
MNANVIVFEAAIFILFLIFYNGGSRAMGKGRHRGFFLGALLFSLAFQTIAVWGGGMNFYWYSVNAYYKHYPLGGYIVWLGLVPLAACLMWYMIAATSQILSALFMPKAKLWSRAAVSGAIAVGFYLLVLPVAVTNHWVTFTMKSFYVFDIPLVALFAIFGSVFLFNAVYELTVLEQKDTKALKKIEDKTIKRLAFKSNRYAKNLTWAQLEWLFLFRLALTLVAFAVYMVPVVVIFWAVANRGAIPPGW